MFSVDQFLFFHSCHLQYSGLCVYNYLESRAACLGIKIDSFKSKFSFFFFKSKASTSIPLNIISNRLMPWAELIFKSTIIMLKLNFAQNFLVYRNRKSKKSKHRHSLLTVQSIFWITFSWISLNHSQIYE